MATIRADALKAGMVIDYASKRTTITRVTASPDGEHVQVNGQYSKRGVRYGISFRASLLDEWPVECGR